MQGLDLCGTAANKVSIKSAVVCKSCKEHVDIQSKLKRPKLVQDKSSSGLALEQLQLDLVFLVSKCYKTKGYSPVAYNIAT